VWFFAITVGEEGTVAMALTAPPAGFDSLPESDSSRFAAVARTGAILAAALDVRFGHLDDSEAIAVMAALEGVGRQVDGASVRR
jgi:uncharacterized membrane protein YebE (DUF533 family)